MPPEAAPRNGLPRLGVAAAVGLVIAVTFASGRPRRIGVDVPAYVDNIANGVWLHDHHLAPRLVAGVGWWIARAIDPATSAAQGAAWTAGAAGAVCAALVAALAAPRSTGWDAAIAAGVTYALTDVGWELSTMFELAHFATAPVLVGALLLEVPSPRRFAAAGVAVAVALSMHLLSAGALVGLVAAAGFAAWRGAPRAVGWGPVVAVVAFLVLAQALFVAIPPPDGPPSTLLGWAARLATPGHNPAPAPPWTLAEGFATACARGVLGAALAVALAIGVGFGARATPTDVFLLATAAAEAALASRIEPTNAEYFDVAIAAAIVIAWPWIMSRIGRVAWFVPVALLWSHFATPAHHRPAPRGVDAGAPPGAP